MSHEKKSLSYNGTTIVIEDDVNFQAAIKIPYYTSTGEGNIRYNTSVNKIEFYSTSVGTWVQAGGDTVPTVPSYEKPTIPQFSRWAPELYLPLNGLIVDESANAWTLTQMGAVPSDFVADSPFGSGQSLRVNPNGSGVTANRQNIDASANATMSHVSGQNYPPWALGFWFKASALPTVAFVVFQTAIPWATYGKGVQIVNTTGRLQIYQFGSSNYEPTTTNLCDGNWHHIMIRYASYSTGKMDELTGKVWIDGVAVGAAAASAFNQPPNTPATKMAAGGDTVETYYLSDFWYTNSIPPDDLASLLWNSGAGKRYSAAGLIA